jgi:para-nitrobenzyl esterase
MRSRRLLLATLLSGLVGIAVYQSRKPDAPEAPAAVVADPAAQRPTAQGPVVGFQAGHGTLAWRGIPFAAPPVGELRWRAPRPPASRAQPLLATSMSAACMQLASEFSGVPSRNGERTSGSEDCLYLNIWAPQDAAPASLPVMVWIHGGANTMSSAAPYLSMDELAGPQRVVVVSLNYRLGVFGWFTHPALRGDPDPNDRSGNFGTLDLIAGLQWVRDNIAAFGGDPGRVTVFGESAGGVNIFSLLAAPQARGLFHRAISQSGMPASYPVAAADGDQEPPSPTPFGSKPLIDQLLVADKLAPDVAAARRLQDSWPAARLLAYLRQKPATALMEPLAGMAPGFLSGAYRWPSVIADGHVLPTGPLMDAISASPVPTLFGTNRDETRTFQSADPAYVDMLFGKLPRIKDKAAYVRDAGYASDTWRLAGVDEPARRRHAAGRPVFAYRFDWSELPSNLLVDLKTLMGAAHGLELGFLLGRSVDVVSAMHGATEANAAGRAYLTAAMQSYWAQFAYAGDPGTGRKGELPAWLGWSSTGPKTLILDAPEAGGIRMVDEQITQAGIDQRLAADASFGAPAERRRVPAGAVDGLLRAALRTE